MSNSGKRQASIVLGDAMSFVSSRVITQNITNQSFSQFIDEALKRIEGETTEDVAGINRNPRQGEISRIRKLREDLNQLSDAIILDPTLLDEDPTRGATEITVARKGTIGG